MNTPTVNAEVVEAVLAATLDDTYTVTVGDQNPLMVGGRAMYCAHITHTPSATSGTCHAHAFEGDDGRIQVELYALKLSLHPFAARSSLETTSVGKVLAGV